MNANRDRNKSSRLESGAGGAEAGGQHQGLRHPGDDQQVEQRLDDIGLEDQGDILEDHQRDRRSSGTAADKRGDSDGNRDSQRR